MASNIRFDRTRRRSLRTRGTFIDKHLHPTNIKLREKTTFGDRAADWVATNVGSWRFVIAQGVLFVIWVTVNSIALLDPVHFDPYPFFFFNLFMSCEAAFATPIIMMSQNRQNEHDRHSAEVNYRNNAETLELQRLIAHHMGVPPEQILGVRNRWAQPSDEDATAR